MVASVLVNRLCATPGSFTSDCPPVATAHTRASESSQGIARYCEPADGAETAQGHGDPGPFLLPTGDIRGREICGALCSVTPEVRTTI